MDQDQKHVETSAKTVDDATRRALEQLGAKRTEVDITVLDEGSKGLFGIGAREARVRVELKSGQPAHAPRERQGERPRGRDDRGGDRGRDRERDDDRRGRGRRGGRGRGGRRDEPTERAAADSLPPKLSEEHFLPRGTADKPEEPVARRDRPDRRNDDSDRGGDGRGNRGGRGRSGGGRGRGQREERREPDIAPDIDAEEVNLACTTIDDLLRILEIEAEIRIREPETPAEGLGSALAVVDLDGANMGLLIGRRGETLTSLQYLVNLIVSRRFPGRAAPIYLDAANYRKRREIELLDLAERMADRVRRSGEPITLEPMPAAERRIIHLALADDPDVSTMSTGAGETRKVEIIPAE